MAASVVSIYSPCDKLLVIYKRSTVSGRNLILLFHPDAQGKFIGLSPKRCCLKQASYSMVCKASLKDYNIIIRGCLI